MVITFLTLNLLTKNFVIIRNDKGLYLTKEINLKKKTLNYKTIDLFCGIGGIRKGFERVGNFENVLSAEIDKYACLTYEHLYNENPFNDVTNEEFKQKVENTKYDILLGGFPCQAFSIAGEKQGFKDKTRGTLFFDVADILQRTKPKAFLLENVEGLLRHDKGKTFKTIINVLVNELNYKVVGVNSKKDGSLEYEAESFIRRTKDFGLPQKRSRTYIIGFRKDIVPKNYKFKSLPLKRENAIFKNVYQILDKSVSAKYYLSEQYIQTLEKHKKSHQKKGNGFGFEVVNKGDNPIANTILATGGSGKERNLIYHENPEYYGKIFGSKKTPINDKGIRVMTPNEWARLQGFKDYAFIDKKQTDTFSFPSNVSETQQYKQLGNSVSIPVIEELAKYIYQNLKEMEIMGFNKGEWSEIYTLLYLLDNPNMSIIDNNLNVINNQLFKILEIILENTNYKVDTIGIKKIKVDGTTKDYLRDYINQNKVLLLSKIKSQKASKGSFDIPEVSDLIIDFFDGKKPKGSAQVKGDLQAKVLDTQISRETLINYNIKSSLGSPATLLNASNNTNFIYEVKNINDTIMNQINAISTRTKLIDRHNTIISQGGSIEFVKVESSTFSSNLRLIDTNLANILADILLLSYSLNEKDINVLLGHLITNPQDNIFYNKKIGDFANAVTFGMRAGSPWNSQNEVTGGILLVSKTGEVYLLDLIYYKSFVDKYLIENIKLESPSSSRYKMFDIYKENGKYYTKLNLQIRFKS